MSTSLPPRRLDPEPGERRSRLVGPASLGAAAAGAAIAHAAPLAGIDAGAWWLAIVRSGFEAALVGGLADWFAVTALFRHPLGIPIPHTAIIPKRRQKLVEGAVSIVQEEWLSPEVIGGRVLRAHPAHALRTWLQDPARVRAVEPTLRTILAGLAQALTQSEIVTGLDRIMREQLRTYPIDAASGQWLSRLAGSEGASTAFDALALSLSRVALQPGTARRMHEWLEHTARHMEEDGRRLMPILLRSHVVRRKVVEAACHFAATELEHAAREPEHPLRRHAFEAVERYAGRLAASEAEALSQLEHLRLAFVRNLSSEPLSAQPLRQLKAQVIAELDRPDSALLASGLGELRALVLRMLADEDACRRFDDWVRRSVLEIVERYHHQIGLTIRESLEALDTDTLVAQVEARLGPDLQFIRLNGALVGGLIGILLALARLLLA